MKFDLSERYARISGRILNHDGKIWFGYSASYAEFSFTGTHAAAQINCVNYSSGDDTFATWIAIYANEAKEPCRRFALSDGTGIYDIFSSDKVCSVTLRVVKLSEAAFGSYTIESIETDDPQGASPTLPSAHRIEFIGDSITCGYGIEGINGTDTFCTSQENPMKAYAVLAAKKLNAEYQLISWSGIGLITQWVADDVNEPLQDVLMPELYLHTDKQTATKCGFSDDMYDGSYCPDLIVINLGTNDSSYTRNIPERESAFADAYYDFLGTVRQLNPDAKILCLLGLMNQDLCGILRKTVERYSADSNDKNVYFHELAMQLDSDGMGSDGHPGMTTQYKVSEELADTVRALYA